MALILVDTDVASFLFKGSDYGDPYRSVLAGHTLALSFMTVAELLQWARVRQWGDRRCAQLEQYCSQYLVIPADLQLCQVWARVRVDRQQLGQVISPQDAWIAATAIRHGLPLVTHNTKDFQDIPDLQLLIPS